MRRDKSHILSSTQRSNKRVVKIALARTRKMKENMCRILDEATNIRVCFRHVILTYINTMRVKGDSNDDDLFDRALDGSENKNIQRTVYL